MVTSLTSGRRIASRANACSAFLGRILNADCFLPALIYQRVNYTKRAQIFVRPLKYKNDLQQAKIFLLWGNGNYFFLV